jgi:hypothetical protein
MINNIEIILTNQKQEMLRFNVELILAKELIEFMNKYQLDLGFV